MVSILYSQTLHTNMSPRSWFQSSRVKHYTQTCHQGHGFNPLQSNITHKHVTKVMASILYSQTLHTNMSPRSWFQSSTVKHYTQTCHQGHGFNPLQSNITHKLVTKVMASILYSQTLHTNLSPRSWLQSSAVKHYTQTCHQGHGFNPLQSNITHKHVTKVMVSSSKVKHYTQTCHQGHGFNPLQSNI